MTLGRDFTKIIEAARLHYKNLKDDISNASTRVEHIRLSSLAQEAHSLLTDLEIFNQGLVYSHTNNTDGYFEEEIQTSNEESIAAAAAGQEPLDLPEFVSPFNPDAK